MNYTQQLRYIISRPYTEQSRRYVESYRREIEDNSNSKGEPDTNILDFAYVWHLEYINNINFMSERHVSAFTRTIEYMELNTSRCVICYSAMDIHQNAHVSNIHLTCCLECHMPICSNCIYAASQVSERCPSCYMHICAIYISHDMHCLVEKLSIDFKLLHQLQNSGVVLIDDLNDDLNE